MSEAQTAEPEKKRTTKTEYVILVRPADADDGAWWVLGSIADTRKEAAIEAVVEGYEGSRSLSGAEFKAVPLSSWKDIYDPYMKTGIRKRA